MLMDIDGCVWIYEYVQMDVDGCSGWMDVDRRERLILGVNVDMDVNGCAGECIDIWMWMDMDRCGWVCMDVDGCGWIGEHGRMGVDERRWRCMDVCVCVDGCGWM
jgi:hypothetical protein